MCAGDHRAPDAESAWIRRTFVVYQQYILFDRFLPHAYSIPKETDHFTENAFNTSFTCGGNRWGVCLRSQNIDKFVEEQC